MPIAYVLFVLFEKCRIFADCIIMFVEYGSRCAVNRNVCMRSVGSVALVAVASYNTLLIFKLAILGIILFGFEMYSFLVDRICVRRFCHILRSRQCPEALRNTKQIDIII